MSDRLITNPYWACNYDELITYYPRFYRDVFEMDAILRSHGGLADGIQDGIEKIFADCFVDKADETAIAMLEKFLGLSLYKQRTLDERRRLVRSFFAGFGRLSSEGIAETIRAYTGADTECSFEICDEAGNNCLYINFERGENDTLYYSDIIQILDRMIPAHIYYVASVTQSFAVAVSKGRKHYLNRYRVAGVYPEVAKLGDNNVVDAAADVDITAAAVDYIPCGVSFAHS